jgi:hypothetical protein
MPEKKSQDFSQDLGHVLDFLLWLSLHWVLILQGQFSHDGLLHEF